MIPKPPNPMIPKPSTVSLLAPRLDVRGRTGYPGMAYSDPVCPFGVPRGPCPCMGSRDCLGFLASLRSLCDLIPVYTRCYALIKKHSLKQGGLHIQI